jgi:hypothetical protein
LGQALELRDRAFAREYDKIIARFVPATATNTDTAMGSQILMSIWDLSNIDLANKLYPISWAGLVIGAILTAIATLTAFWSSGVREMYSDSRTASLEAAAEHAKLEQARLSESNLKLQIDLERERGARLEIESRLSSRRVSTQQCQRLLEDLSKVQPLHQTLVIVQSDEEQARYGNDIVTCLSKTGAHVSLQRNGIMLGVAPGLSVELPSTESGQSFRKAFAAAGIEARYEETNGDSIVIVVGPKLQRF